MRAILACPDHACGALSQYVEPLPCAAAGGGPGGGPKAGGPALRVPCSHGPCCRKNLRCLASNAGSSARTIVCSLEAITWISSPALMSDTAALAWLRMTVAPLGIVTVASL